MIATLFDFNGVLVDDEAVHFGAFRDVVQPLGIALDPKTYGERYLGFDDLGAFRAMLIDAGQSPSEKDLAALVDAKKPVYLARAFDDGELTIFEGAAELVVRRAKLGGVGIVSGALRHEIERALDLMGVRSCIQFIVSAEDAPNCKPHPEGYLLGLRALGIDTEAPSSARAGVVVLEDSLAGVVAAKRANLRCAAVAHSYQPHRLYKAGADVVVMRLSDLSDAAFDGPPPPEESSG